VLTIELVDLNIKIDKNLKEELEIFAEDIGLTVSDILNDIVKKVVTEQKVTFEAFNYRYSESKESEKWLNKITGIAKDTGIPDKELIKEMVANKYENIH